MFEEKSRAALAAETLAKAPATEASGPTESLASASWAAPPKQAYTTAPGRKHMYTQDGAPITSHRRTHADKSIATGQQINNSSYAPTNIADVLREQPVTIYSQRLAEGVMSGVTARAGAPNPFSKNSRWTNDIRDPRNITAGAVDRQSVANLGDGRASAVGAHLAILPFAVRIREAAVHAGGMHGVRALRRALYAMPSLAALGSVLRSIGGPLLSSEVAIVGVWLEALPTRSIAEKAAQLMLLVSANLIGDAAAVVAEAFAALDRSGAGVVSVELLASTYDASQDLAVVTGSLTAEQARAEFFGEMMLLGGESVDAAAFTLYFSDVAAATDDVRLFRQHLCGVWRYVGVGMRGLKVTITQRDVLTPVSTLEILDTAGLGPLDFHRMRARLHRQGIHQIVRIELATGEAMDFETL